MFRTLPKKSVMGVLLMSRWNRSVLTATWLMHCRGGHTCIAIATQTNYYYLAYVHHRLKLALMCVLTTCKKMARVTVLQLRRRQRIWIKFTFTLMWPMNYPASVLWHCWLSITKSILLVKTEWWGASMAICLQRGASDLHMVQLMPLPPHHLLLHYNWERFTFLVPGYPGFTGKDAIKYVSKCVCTNYMYVCCVRNHRLP